MKKILQGALLLSAGFIGSAQAVSIGLNTDDSRVNLGETVKVGINFDFDSESFGGTFQLSYDDFILNNPVFNFSSASDLGGFGVQDNVSRVDYGVGKLDISFGTLSFGQGVFGAGLLGYLTFDTIAEGSTVISLKDTLGGFTDFNTFSTQAVDYQNVSVDVVSSVPVLAALWLFASACGVLVGRRNKIT